MPKSTQTPTFVLNSLMEEYGLNPFTLAKGIGLSYSAVRMLALGNFKVSVPTALRLAKYFGKTPEFWLSLQQKEDLLEAGKDKNLQADLKRIKKAVKKAAKPAAAKAKAVKPKASKAPKTAGKSRKKVTLSDKRKAAAKVPGAKPASRKK